MPLTQRAATLWRYLPRLFVAAILCVTAIGCGDDGLSPEADLDRARALQRWNAQGLSSYTVEARIVCFCSPALQLWHELTVVNDTVTAVRLVDTGGQEIPSDEVLPSYYDSVDELFERIEQAARATDGSRVEAQFDATTGLPVEVNFIAPPGVADGGATHYRRALKPALSN